MAEYATLLCDHVTLKYRSIDRISVQIGGQATGPSQNQSATATVTSRDTAFRVLRPRFWRKCGQVEILCDYSP